MSDIVKKLEYGNKIKKPFGLVVELAWVGSHTNGATQSGFKP